MGLCAEEGWRMRNQFGAPLLQLSLPLSWFGEAVSTHTCRYSSVVEHALRKRTVVDSIPTGGFHWTHFIEDKLRRLSYR